MRTCRTCGRESDERYCSPQCRLFARKQLDTRWELVIKSTQPLEDKQHAKRAASDLQSLSQHRL